MELSAVPVELVTLSVYTGPVHSRPFHARPASVVSPLAAAVHSPVLHTVLVHCLELLPLVRLQLHANVQQKTRVSFFQFAARAHDPVDLRFNRGAVRSIGLHQRAHRQLCLLQSGLQVDQLQTMVLKNSIHRLALIVSERQLRREVRIVPELAESELLPLPPKPAEQFSTSSLISPPLS